MELEKIKETVKSVKYDMYIKHYSVKCNDAETVAMYISYAFDNGAVDVTVKPVHEDEYNYLISFTAVLRKNVTNNTYTR